MEYRPYYLAREWVRLGHRVRIVAADHSHVRARQPQAGGETIDGIEYDWRPTPAYQGNGVGRAWNIARFLWPLWRRAGAVAAGFRPDVVIASSTYPMDIWVARRIARARRRAAGVRGARPVAAVAHRAVGHVAAPPLHPPMCRRPKRRLPRCRRGGVHAAQGARLHGLAWADLRKLHIVPNGITLDEWQGEPAALRETWPWPAAARGRRRHRRGLCRLDGLAQCAGYPARCRGPAARRTAALRAGGRRSRARTPGTACGRTWSTWRCCRRSRRRRSRRFWPPGHRLHRLAARAHLPLRHRAQQADGLHDGRLRCAAFGGGRQRPGGRKPAAASPWRRSRPTPWPTGCAPGSAAGSRAPRRWANAAAPFVLAHHTYPVLAQRFCRPCNDERAHSPERGRRGGQRYARRSQPGRYSLLQPDVWQSVQERQRALLRLLVRLGLTEVSACTCSRWAVVPVATCWSAAPGRPT
jgi:hypothetical protein